jgi:hypothetical protein
MSRVFVSSTCYDLVDLRAEVKACLEGAGLVPVMSDDIDNFEVSGRAESIETCLINVRNSDCFVCVLSQRYGPSLLKAGYDDISATHLEYREARSKQLPIYMFVRDRLEAEHSLAQSHLRKHGSLDGFQTRWVPAGNYRIFDLLAEHSALARGAASTNWFTTFSTSIDLKERLLKMLSLVSSRALLTKLIDSAALPILTAVGATFRASSSRGVVLHNLSNIPALDIGVALVFGNEIGQGYFGDLAGTSQLDVGLVPDTEAFPPRFHVTFTTPGGYRITQDFVIEAGKYMRSTVRLRDRGGFQIG